MTDILKRAAEALDGVTPGPWRVGPVDDTRVEDADGLEVAQIDGDYNDPDLWPKMEANARFIAAARTLTPDMAAEIERLTKWRAEEGEKIRRQAKALADLQAHCARVESECDGLARKVAAVQRSGDDLAHSELADLQARVHNQRQEIKRLTAERDALDNHVSDMLAGQECACGYDAPHDVCLGHWPLHQKTISRAEAAEAKLAEVTAERDHYKDLHENESELLTISYMQGAKDAEDMAKAKIARLVEGLRFYADLTHNGYDAMITDYGLSLECGEIINDGGDRARAILAEIKGADHE